MSVLLGNPVGLGDADGTFGAASNIDFAVLGSSPASVAVGDFNADGKLDLGVTSNVYHPATPGYTVVDSYGYLTYYPGSPSYNEGQANVLLGSGTGSFESPVTFSVGYYPYSLAAGDVNADGKLDDVSVLLGTGTGASWSFGAATNYAAGSQPQAVAMADFNADGKIDLVTANGNAGTVSVLLGNGNGSFQPARDYAAGALPVSVTVGDFNGDRLPDVAVVNANSNDVSVLLNDGIWHSFLVSGFPSPTTAGDAHAITVTALDTAGNVLTGYTGTVTFSSSDGQAVLPGS